MYTDMEYFKNKAVYKWWAKSRIIRYVFIIINEGRGIIDGYLYVTFYLVICDLDTYDFSCAMGKVSRLIVFVTVCLSKVIVNLIVTIKYVIAKERLASVLIDFW